MWLPHSGSPFQLEIADSNALSVFGEQLKLATVERLTSFFVHANGVECHDLSSTVACMKFKISYIALYYLLYLI